MNKILLLNKLRTPINQKKTHFITYGDERFTNSKIRILQEAKNSNFFKTYQIYGPENLSINFKNNFQDILKEKRGGGYWIWKIDIILNKLSQLKDGEFLIYMDCGCSIKKDGIKRLNEYLHLLNNSKYGIISFQLTNELEKEWTTKEIFDYFKINKDKEIYNSKQFMSTILIMQKKKHLLDILEIYSKVLVDNRMLFTDKYNNKQEEYFKDNRHDQSIFSIIRKLYGSIAISDETYNNQRCKVMSG